MMAEESDEDIFKLTPESSSKYRGVENSVSHTWWRRKSNLEKYIGELIGKWNKGSVITSITHTKNIPPPNKEISVHIEEEN